MKSYIVYKADGGKYVIAKLDTYTGVYHDYVWMYLYLEAQKVSDLLNKNEETLDQ